MKLGILGSGKIVAEVLEVLTEIEDIEILAISARKEEKLQKICQDYNIGKYYLSIDELVADPDVEVVYVALPNTLHYGAMKKAIAAGKDIICEKPFTTNIAEAREIADLARQAGVLVLEAISHRFIPNALAAKEKLRGLGQIKIGSFNYSQYSSRYDNFRKGIIEPVFTLENAGGALVDLNLYNISFAVDSFGLPKEAKYYANMDRGIDTSGIAILDYGDFKITCIGSKDTSAPVISTIQGIDGTIEIEGPINAFEKFSLSTSKENSKEKFDFNNPEKSRLYYEFVDFVKIIEDRDFSRAGKLMDMTLAYMEVMTKLRLGAGIKFATDK